MDLANDMIPRDVLVVTVGHKRVMMYDQENGTFLVTIFVTVPSMKPYGESQESRIFQEELRAGGPAEIMQKVLAMDIL